MTVFAHGGVAAVAELGDLLGALRPHGKGWRWHGVWCVEADHGAVEGVEEGELGG